MKKQLRVILSLVCSDRLFAIHGVILYSVDLMKNLDQATIDTAHQLIADLEAMIEAGTPPSETQVKKLDKLF